MRIITVTAALFFYISSFATAANDPLVLVEGINTMTADFTQTNTIKDFGDDIYEGHLIIKSGEKALWDYHSPFVSWYLFSKETITQYDGANNQVIIYEGNHTLSNILLQILMDIKSVKNQFNITSSDGVIKLVPKDDIGIKDIFLKTENGTVTEMTSIDSVGNISKITFKNVKINIPLSDNAFVKKAPKDAEIFKHK